MIDHCFQPCVGWRFDKEVVNPLETVVCFIAEPVKFRKRQNLFKYQQFRT